MNVIQFWQCPYCIPFEGGHCKKVPKKIGLFRIKTFQSNNNILICECQKCKRVFRLSVFGTPLLWSDLSIQEKALFKSKDWIKKQMRETNGKHRS